MCESLVAFYKGVKVLRYDLENDLSNRNLITEMIIPIWQKYEPWTTYNDVYQTVSRKVGRTIDILFDEDGAVLGFYIFRVFKYGSWKVMFRGNTFISSSIRGIGVLLLKSAIKHYSPDKIVTFTSEERIYALLNHFGEIVPALNKKISLDEWQLLSKLAGSTYELDKDTLMVRDFYQYKHQRQGNFVKSEYVRSLFGALGKKDAYALLVRCK
ncbi:MAG: hypothetical protein UZ19_OD1000963 [Parcubacteria bacterium OLB19]|nr:MAG: hypothetical protein UZ19_OD1000963 [Parcubacteria bacterium OLB19]